MIEATALTKRFGVTLAVDELSFTVRPGQVTGFLGPKLALRDRVQVVVFAYEAGIVHPGQD